MRLVILGREKVVSGNTVDYYVDVKGTRRDGEAYRVKVSKNRFNRAVAGNRVEISRREMDEAECFQITDNTDN